MPQQFNEILEELDKLPDDECSEFSSLSRKKFNEFLISALSKVRQQTIDEVMKCKDNMKYDVESRSPIFREGISKTEVFNYGRDSGIQSWTDEIIKIR